MSLTALREILRCTLMLSHHNKSVALLQYAISSGALASLEKLYLDNNQIGDEGMIALAEAITPNMDGKGALASLKDLRLYENRIGDAGFEALAKAITPRDGKGALASLETLSLQMNDIGGDGKMALSSACSSGALASLNTLTM